MEKKELRKALLIRRSEIPENVRAEKSRRICERVLALDEYKKAEIVLAYIPYRQEADVWPVIEKAWRDGKQVGVPRVLSDENNTAVMEFYRIRSREDLSEGYKGIFEPAETCELIRFTGEREEEHPGSTVFMAAPGTAFTADGWRIGYGKGFYDRYLASHPGIFSAGICYEEQVLESLPVSEYDRQLDLVISE